MQSSTHTSPLLNHAIRTRAKNVELRKKIAQLQTDIQAIEKDISTITLTYDDLVEQCRSLREKQTDASKDFLLEESQQQFQNYIHDIENYINSKQWAISPSNKIEEIPIQTLHDDLNQQLASVENWLMESAIPTTEKQIIENQHKENETDDLYKDLILPDLSEEIHFNENSDHEDFVKAISPSNSKQRPDKNQRRFALMRQLAEKSNKTVTKKLL